MSASIPPSLEIVRRVPASPGAPRKTGDAIAPSKQYMRRDDCASYPSQIATLERICRERLDVINVLDAEVKRLAAAKARNA